MSKLLKLPIILLVTILMISSINISVFAQGPEGDTEVVEVEDNVEVLNQEDDLLEEEIVVDEIPEENNEEVLNEEKKDEVIEETSDVEVVEENNEEIIETEEVTEENTTEKIKEENKVVEETIEEVKEENVEVVEEVKEVVEEKEVTNKPKLTTKKTTTNNVTQNTKEETEVVEKVETTKEVEKEVVEVVEEATPKNFTATKVEEVVDKEVEDIVEETKSVSPMTISGGTGDTVESKVTINVGFNVIDGVTYYYPNVGKTPLKGQHYIDGYWYCFDLSTGAMKTGPTYLNKSYEPSGAKMVVYNQSGRMLYGMQRYNGKYYYLDYGTGAATTGQFYLNGYWYCGDLETGALKVGLVHLTKAYEPAGAKTVLYDNRGRMLYGLQSVNGKNYYFNTSTGEFTTGQFHYNGYWYCGDLETGELKVGLTNLTKAYEPAGAKTVLYDTNGRMLYGMHTVDNKKYYFNTSTGAVTKGQFSYNGGWYCGDLKTGELKTGLVELTKDYEKSGAKTVLYNSNGKMLYGFQTYNKKKYYFDTQTGAMKKGLFKVGSKTYGANIETGELLSGVVELSEKYDGKARKVYFNEDGSMNFDSKLINGELYFFNQKNGEMLTAEDGKAAMHGIDISEHNWWGNHKTAFTINSKEDLIPYQNQFVIIRIGYRNTKDPRFETYLSWCQELGIPYGVYMFSYAETRDAARQEAKNFIQWMDGREAPLGAWYDMEKDSYKSDYFNNNFERNGKLISDMCKIWCDEVSKAGYHVGIYASYSVFNDGVISGLDNYDKWVAHYGTNNGKVNVDMSDYADIHQYTSNPLDKNLSYVSLNHFEIKDQYKNAVKPDVEETDTSIGTAKILATSINIRTGAGTNYSTVGSYATKGETYKVYEIKTDSSYTWYRIGTNRWIANDPDDPDGAWVEYTKK